MEGSEKTEEKTAAETQLMAYVYVNVNHSDLAACAFRNWGGFALIKKPQAKRRCGFA
jgi:hypothetical protein